MNAVQRAPRCCASTQLLRPSAVPKHFRKAAPAAPFRQQQAARRRMATPATCRHQPASAPTEQVRVCASAAQLADERPPTGGAAPGSRQPELSATQSRTDAMLLLAAGLLIFGAAAAPEVLAAATAADSVTYDNAAASENLRSAFGVGYVLLVIFFAVRLLTRRAARAKNERLAGKQDAGSEEATSPPQPEPLAAAAAADVRATAFGALYGAAQAAFLATVLWTVTTAVSGFFDAKTLPDNYTARNISVAVKTAVEGLAYLLTFIFGANAVGLAALAVQLAVFPESVAGPAEAPRAADKDALPKIKLTDNLYDIRRAFEEVQREAAKPSGGSGGKDGGGA